MFGYIRTDTPELLVRENEYYKAVYCGLCRAQGRCTGQCSRMTLSYDVAFLALLRLAISEEQPKIKRKSCIAHPFKKRTYVDSCEALDYCAYAYAILAYGKAIDDIADEKGAKKLKARLVAPFTRRMRKKAIRKNYAPLDEAVNNALARLSETEKQKLPSVDIPADRFGDVMADILSYGFEGNNAKIMRNIGRHIGRWIYIVDAADDLSEDLEKNRFNPFACLFGEKPLDDAQKADVATSLRLELMEAEKAFDLIDYKEPTIEGIINNIIYRGMPDVAERVLGINGKSKHNNRKKQRIER